MHRRFLTLPLPLWIVIMVVFDGCFGCSVSYNLSGGVLQEGLETISVEQFENDAPIVVPSLAQDFTLALQDRFVGQTNLKLIQFDGHIQLSGAITRYQVAPIAIQGNETAAQNRLSVSITVTYVNLLDPEAGWEETFPQFEDFSSDVNLEDVETDLIVAINEKLTLDIFNKVLSNW